VSEQVSQTVKRHVRVERGIFKRETKAGAVYEFNFTGSDGKTHWQTARRLSEARKQRSAKIAAVARGERVAPSRMTVDEVAETWFELKAPKLRKRTADYYRSALELVVLPRLGRMNVQSVDADVIARLIRDLEREGLHAIDPHRAARPLGRSSIENYLKPLQGILAYAVRRGLITTNPFTVLTEDDRPERPEEAPPHEWTDGELEALLAASRQLAGKPESRYDYTPLLRLIATLGLRKGEALGLKWQDIDRIDGALSIRRQWLASSEYGPPKTKAGTRRIALPADLRDELIRLRLRSRFSQDNDPIFASLTGKPLGHRNVLSRGWEPARDAAGLPSSLTLHDLRHAAASRMINAKLDPVTVAAVLGHEDATVTLKVYGHVWDRRRTDDDVRKALTGGRKRSPRAR
jgi:integrase